MKKDEAQVEKDEGQEQPTVKRVLFIYRPHWFVLSQTEGEPYQPADLPNWSEERALQVLDILRVPFELLDGNVQGYASGRTVAVSPIAFEPHRTLIHELAHVVLGHTADAGRLVDEERTPRNIREVEAESVAMFCCASLAFPGAEDGIEHSRGYIQNWLRTDTISDRVAQRIFKAADQILKAGYPPSSTQEVNHDGMG